MLRNTRIRTRLALMAFAPAVTALVLVGIVLALVPSISIGGPTYNSIKVGKDFQRNTLAPGLYIIELNDDVQQLALATLVAGQKDALITDIDTRRKAYDQAYQTWSQESALADPQVKADLATSRKYAESYLNIYDKQFLPAVKSGSRNGQDAVTILQTSLVDQLTRHRIALESAAARVDGLVKKSESDSNARIRQQLLVIIGITLLLIAAGIAIGLTVLRSITDRVRRLNEVATVELPRVLVEVQRAAAAGEEIPSMPEQASEGVDELSSAASAFNSVVATAVEMAAQQSRMRRATSQMFINLGRRNHKLLSRTLTYITQLESDERDPATLQNLFRLDHLTTRMRRHAESLLVLAGSPPLRTWSRPVPVADVLRAALSEIETYDRVDIKELEPVEVRGASVSDLAHLIAELLENATAFSPPQTRVRVLGRTDHDGYTVVVVDEGIGMSPEELAAANTLITTADQSGLLSDSRMLGLGVVGRLAARHGFRVHLTASPVGGVVAWVTLASSALAPRRGAVEPELGLGSVPAGYNGAGSDVAGLLGAPSGPAAAGSTGSTPDSGPPGVRAVPAPASGQREELAFGSSATNGRTPPHLTPDDLSRRPAAAPRPEPVADRGDHRGAGQEAPSWGAPVERERTAADPYLQPGRGEPGGRPAPVSTGSFQLPPPPPPAREMPAGPPGGPLTGMRGVPPMPSAHRQQLGRAGGPNATEPIQLPPAPDGSPVSGPISFRKPPARPGEGTGLTRRVRGAQLPDTGDAPQPVRTDDGGARPQRSAQSVRGALASFSAGRRTAAEVTIGNAADLKRAEPRPASNGAAHPLDGDPVAQPASAAAAQQVGAPGPLLPRRVRGAQMPQTDLPVSAPAPERSAAEVRAALSNFVAGRRAAEHED